MALTGAVVFDLAIVNAKKLTFSASFGGDVVCDNKGKPREFKSVDDLYAAALAVNPGILSITHTALDTVGVASIKLPSDPIKAATSHRTKMQNLKAAAVARKTDATNGKTAYAAYNGGNNPAFQAIYDEFVAVEAALTDAITFYDAAIAADTALIGS